MNEPLICYCTCPDEEVALALARQMVEQRLAACVNILPAVQSVYRWQGKVETAGETMLWLKTTRRHFPALEAALRQAHPYELPEIVAVSIADGSEAYLQWLKDSLC